MLRTIKNYNFKSFSLSIVALVLGLGSVGIFLIQRLQDEDEMQFEKQVIGYGAGLVIMAFVILIDYHLICKFVVPLYLLNIALMLFTAFTSKASGLPVYGKSHYDAKRWIEISKGGKPLIEFMPSELTKLVIIISLAVLFSRIQKDIKKFWVIIVAGIIGAIPILMVFVQPDLSTSIVLFLVFCVIVFAAGVNIKYLLAIFAGAIPVVIGLFWYVTQDWQRLLSKYQRLRILAMLDPTEHPDKMFQQNNAKLAIQAGKVFGKLLLGDTSKRVTDVVPVVESDFIFSAIGEEFGMIGMFLTIGAYFLFAVLGLKIARKAKDTLGRLLAVGITSLLSIQAFVNMGVVTSLLPNTGIPLPFVSSGLTALITNLATLGILLNISLQPSGYIPGTDSEFEFRLKERGNVPNDFSKI